MRKLALLTLAAGTVLLPAAVLAEPGGARHPGPPAGHSWSHGGSRVVVRNQGGHHVGVRHHPGRHFRHGRLQRGFVMHPYWFGPQFHVRDWRLYGFAPPPDGHRWVRYYDDAYLIDGGGRVHDSRFGLDWDEYGESWTEEDGIPAYHGRGDFHPDDEDYAWVAEHEGPAYAHEMADGPPYPSGGCVPAPRPVPCGGWGGPGHYGYGYGYAYPIIIETTVTTGAGGYVTETVEEVVEVRPRTKYRTRRAAPPRRPRPPAGERG